MWNGEPPGSAESANQLTDTSPRVFEANGPITPAFPASGRGSLKAAPAARVEYATGSPPLPSAGPRCPHTTKASPPAPTASRGSTPRDSVSRTMSVHAAVAGAARSSAATSAASPAGVRSFIAPR
ncbi:MAG TPA: hypothetical protein VF517_07010 [Thermoleophilaceae bacterium]